MIDVTNMNTVPPLKRLHQKRRQPLRTRSALLDAAVEIIDKEGWSAVTTTRVAAQAGLSRGALQHHFYASNELLLAVADELGAKLNGWIEPSDLLALPLAVRVERLLAHYYEVYSSRLFRAVMSLLLDPASTVAVHIRKKNYADQDRIHETWRAAFSDTGVSESKLSGLRRMAMATVRGYALREQITEGDSWSEDLVLLQEFLLRELQNAG